VKRALVLLALLAALPSASATLAPLSQDWLRYGYDTARSNDNPNSTGITSANVAGLVADPVSLDGTVDSSPIYVNGVFFVTTTYGKTEAIVAGTDAVLWKFVPPTYSSFAGSVRITNASPAAGAARTAIYAAAPDGYVRKLDIANGSVLWATQITLDPSHEKLTSSLNVANGIVYATTGGYVGDAPPYQGHVVAIDASTGAVKHVWNSLCADRHELIVPSSCAASDSAIWSRSGAALDPFTGEIVVASGNGPYNGTTNFGDSVAILSPDASRLKRFWAPADQLHLENADLDLGSTSPAFLAGDWAVQGGKDGTLKLLDLRGPRLVQTLPLPGGAKMFSEPAVWNHTIVFVSVSTGTVAYRFVAMPQLHAGKLVSLWSNSTGGTSPVVAGGLLYIAGFDGQLHVYVPSTGEQVATLPTGPLHWQSPIVADGRVAMPVGNANNHQTSGILDIFRLP
jgi:outer membrane protein assembly factor BamB